MLQTALVTGASRGIGLEVCRELHRQGYVVLLGARQLDLGERAAAEIAAGDSDVQAVALDVCSEQGVAALAERARREDWELDVLVNNAGVSLQSFGADVVMRTLATNVFGAIRVTDALLPFLRTGARVVNVSSGMGELSGLGAELRRRFEAVRDRASLLELSREFERDVRSGRHSARGWPTSAYAVSKVALNAFTRLLAGEQPRLRVNAVCPGWVRTEMGGSSAPRSAAEGAAGIVWAATLPADGPSGGFFRDAHRIPW